MRDPGTNAGVNVPSQGLWLESQGLSQNNFIPEMAAYGSTSRKRKTWYVVILKVHVLIEMLRLKVTVKQFVNTIMT